MDNKNIPTVKVTTKTFRAKKEILDKIDKVLSDNFSASSNLTRAAEEIKKIVNTATEIVEDTRKVSLSKDIEQLVRLSDLEDFKRNLSNVNLYNSIGSVGFGFLLSILANLCTGSKLDTKASFALVISGIIAIVFFGVAYKTRLDRKTVEQRLNLQE